MTTSISSSKDGVDYAKQDVDLMDLANRLDAPSQTGTDPVAPASTLPTIEADIEVYKRLVKPTCFLMAVVMDWINRRFLKKSFRPLSDEQVEMVEPDMAQALKKTFDAILPEIAKRNPEWFCLAITFVGIYAANTEDLPKADPEKETPQPTPAPAMSAVTV